MPVAHASHELISTVVNVVAFAVSYGMSLGA